MNKEQLDEIALRVAHERTRPTQKVSVAASAIMGLIAGSVNK